MNSDIFAIFQQQAKEHLHSFEQELLQLEKELTAHGLKKIMHNCHTLKGAARAIGLTHVKELMHAWEDVFSQVQQNKLCLSPQKTNVILQGIDTLQKSLQNLSLEEIQKSGIVTKIVEEAIQLQKDDKAVQTIQQEKPQPKEKDVLQEAPEIKDALQEDESQEDEPQKDKLQETTYSNIPEVVVEQRSHSSEQSLVISTEAIDNIYRHIGKLKVLQQLADEIQQNLKAHHQQQTHLSNQLHKLKNSASEEDINKIIATQKRIHKKVQQEMHNSEHLANELQITTSILDEEVVNVRLKKLQEIFCQFPRMVRDIAQEYKKQVNIHIHGEHVKIDKAVLGVVKNPVLQLLRNAVGHGIELPEQREKNGKSPVGTITISATEAKHDVVIEVKDDGHGIDSEKIRRQIINRGDLTKETAYKLGEKELMEFLFLPGFTTSETVTDLYGRGVGLDIVKSEVEKIGGRLEIRSQKGQYTIFTLRFPTNISLTPILLVSGGIHSLWGEQMYAIPVNQILSVHNINIDDTVMVEDRQMIRLDNRLLPLVHLGALFSLQSNGNKKKKAIIIGFAGRCGALLVDEILHQENIVVHPLDQRLGKFQDILGTTTLKNGKGALVVDTHDLINTIHDMSFIQQIEIHKAEKQQISVLLVEDSITVRELVNKVLQKHDYKVIPAVDGQDGLNKFEQHDIDIIITDIDMPRLNGFQMVKEIRGSKKSDIPVIFLSYKEREQDRQQAFDLGAKKYLTKADFDHGTLLTTLENILDKKR